MLIDADDSPTLDALDAVLASASDRVERTRKGRVWDIWVRGRPIHVQAGGRPPKVMLSAGCNEPEVYAILREVADKFISRVGGIASEPEK